MAGEGNGRPGGGVKGELHRDGVLVWSGRPNFGTVEAPEKTEQVDLQRLLADLAKKE